jgi:hypothetical protein
VNVFNKYFYFIAEHIISFSFSWCVPSYVLVSVNKSLVFQFDT